MNKKNKNIKYRQINKLIAYIVICFAVLWSGGAATYALFNNWPIFAFFLAIIILIWRNIKIQTKQSYPVIVLTILLCVQMIVHGGGVTTMIHQFLIMIDVFLFSFLIAPNFPKCYVKVITIFALISIPFYLFVNLGFHGVLMSISNMLPQLGVENMWANDKQTDLHTLYLYNIYDSEFSVQGLSRNPGPFWEPGRFTIYLNIAILINLFYYRKNLFEKNTLILIFTNITAMSTTGLSVMILILFTYLLKGNSSKRTKVFLGISLIACLPLIFSLDFMSGKVGDEMESDATYSRFGAIAYHWSQIVQSPFLGFGPFLSNVFGDDLASSPNGVTDSIRYYGIPTALFVWFLLYKGTKIYIKGKLERIFTFCVLMILAFTQTIMTSPFYLMLYMFSIQKLKSRKRNLQIKSQKKLHVRLSSI